MLMVAVAMFAFIACGDDDKDDNGGKNTNPSEQQVNPSDVIGSWTALSRLKEKTELCLTVVMNLIGSIA